MDEAGIKITPDTSGFAAQLRSELEREIAAATAGLDDTIHINIDVDSDAARAKLAESLDEFGDDGTRAFNKLDNEQNDLFDGINKNTEKTRDKVVLETTKTRDRVNQRLEPFWRKLKLKLVGTKKDFDNVKKSALDASKAMTGVTGNGSGASAVARAEKERAAAYAATKAALDKLNKAEQDLARARSARDVNDTRLLSLEEKMAAAEERHERTGAALAEAERKLAREQAQRYPHAERLLRNEEELSKAREAHNKSTAAYYEVESRVTAAKQAGVDATNKITNAEETHSTAREKSIKLADELAEANRRLGDAEDEHNRKVQRSSTLLGKLRNVFSSVGSAITDLIPGMGSAGDATDEAGKSATKAAGGFTLFSRTGAIVVGVAGLLGPAIGLVGTALGILPGLAANAGIAFGVVKLGMDGIKKAAEQLKPAFEDLKKSISDTFEKQLTPVFARLKPLIEGLKAPLNEIAVSLSGMASKFVDVVTSGKGMEQINTILQGTKGFIDALTPAVGSFTEAFLQLAALAQPALQQLGQAVSEFAAKLSDIATKMAGPIQQAFTGLVDVMDAVFDVFIQLTEMGIELGAALNDNLATALRQVGDMLRSLTPTLEGLGRLFLDLVGIIANVVQAFSPLFNTISQVAAAIGDALAQAIQTATPALTGLATAVTDLLGVFEPLAPLLGPIAQAIGVGIAGAADLAAAAIEGLVGIIHGLTAGLGNLTDFLGITTGKFEEFKAKSDESFSKAGDAMKRFAHEGDAAVGKIPPSLDKNIVQPVNALPGQIAPGANAAGAAIPPPFQNAANQVGQSMGQVPGHVQTNMTTAAANGKAGAVALLGNVRQPITQVPALTQEQFHKLPQIIKNQLAESAENAKNGGKLIPRGLEEPMSEIPGVTQRAFNQVPPIVQDELRRAVQASRTGAAPIPNEIRTAMGPASDAARDALAPVAPTVAQTLAGAPPAAAAAGQDTQRAFNDPLIKIPGLTGTALAPTPEAARAALLPTPDAVQEVGGLAAQRATAGAKETATNAVDPLTGVPKEVSAALAPLPDAVRVPMESAAQAAKTGADAVAKAFDLTPVVEKVNTAMNSISTAFENGFTTINNAANTFKGQITTAFTAVQMSVQQAATAIQTAMTTITTAITTGATGALQTITTNFDQIKQKITESMDQSKQKVEETMRAIAQVIQSEGQTAVQNAQKVGEDILKVFTDLADQMEQAGRTMMERLAAGITAGGASAVAAAQGVAAQIKAQFPSSPAKEGPLSGSGDTQVSGGKIMTRLGEGMEAKAEEALSKVRKVAEEARRIIDSINQSGGGGGDKGFAGNSAADPNRGRAGYSQAEDGSWVPSNYWDKRNARQGGVAQGGTAGGMTPQQVYQAVAAGVAAGMPGKLRIEDDGRNGVARLSNRGNRSMGRQ